MIWARMRQDAVRRMAVVPLLAALAGGGVWLAHQSDGVVTGGPVVVLGIDAEDGGIGAHGPVSAYSDVITSMLGQVANGGSGILVIGGGKFPTPPLQDEVTAFWTAVDTNLLTTTLAYVNGAAGITAASFNGFALLAVVSSESEAPSGGLTDDENTALVGRSADIADFVNNGGGLIGLTQSGVSSPYLYLGGIGGFTGNQGLDYSDITPLPAGTAVGITDDLDVCCWHDDFTDFPSFLSVLATNAETGNPVALGGSRVVIEPPTSSSTSSSTVAPTTSPTTSTTTSTLPPNQTTTSSAPPTTRVQATTTTTRPPSATTTTVRATPPSTVPIANATPARLRLTG